MIIDNPDIPESKFPKEILMRLLCDQSSKRNIIWATDDYAHLGEGFYFNQTIEIPLITGSFEGIIKPRSEKAKDIQNARSKDKAEVFTPSWVCNKQNNLIDEQWFGRPNVFNTETENGWITNYNKIEFSDEPGKTWRDYVKDVRMEITCGEAPYITSRYDTVTGKFIEPMDRIGILDRKFRVVLENYGPGTEYKKWFKWMRQGIIQKVTIKGAFSKLVSSTKPFGIRKDLFNMPERYPQANLSEESFDNSIKIYGVKGIKGGAKRRVGYITRETAQSNIAWIDTFKLFFTTSYSTGAIEFPEIIVAKPGEICTETFIVIGPFDTEQEQQNCLKYTKTNLFKILLFFGKGSMQVTQEVFCYVPLQNFTAQSDIDWSKSIPEIDQQLYAKYNLSENEIAFIEKMIKPM